MELSCKIQNYEWGKKGLESKVAQLQKNSNPNMEIKENIPYAELWMGTHVNGPSLIKSTNEKLSDVITKHPEYLGENVLNKFKELPFLFKVLSVNKALSIQAHPSKEHAEELHAKFPNIYKDPNHKPEMAIALTPFEVLCGFKPLNEIKGFFNNIEELKPLLGCFQKSIKHENFVQIAFHKILTAEKSLIKTTVDNILQNYRALNEHEYLINFTARTDKLQEYEMYRLVERLHSQYPYDNGILMVYFLNYITLKPNQAIFLGANEPHAYLFGDCIECMACSDNVVRAGLTPKFIDIDTLCSMLKYENADASTKLFNARKEDNYSVIFEPPVPDFAVVQITVPEGTSKTYKTKKRTSASIILMIAGEADYNNDTKIIPGTVLFLPAFDTLELENIKGDLLIYQALANV